MTVRLFLSHMNLDSPELYLHKDFNLKARTLREWQKKLNISNIAMKGRINRGTFSTIQETLEFKNKENSLS